MSLERCEVVIAYRFIEHLRKLILGRFGSTFNHKRTAAIETIDDLRTTNRSVLHTGKRTQAIFKFVQENNSLFIVCVLLSSKSHLRSYEAVNLPTRIGVDVALQTTQKQSRSCQEHHCKCDFTNDEGVSQTVLRSSCR